MEQYSYFYLGKQDTEPQYLVLAVDNDRSKRNDFIEALSKYSLLALIDSCPDSFKNLRALDNQIYSSFSTSSLNLGLQDRIQLHHEATLWDCLDALIQDDATFKLIDNEQEHSFSELSFSMKSDEVTLVELDSNGTKRIHTIWTTPSIHNTVGNLALIVKCSRDLYDRMFSEISTIEDDEKTVTFFFDFLKYNCIWESSYSLTRFFPCELSYYCLAYHYLHSFALGWDIGFWLQAMTNGKQRRLYTHLNGKTLNASSTIAFRMAVALPNADVLSKKLLENYDQLKESILSNNSRELLRFVSIQIPGTQHNTYLEALCKGLMMSYKYKHDSEYTHKLQQDITSYACKIFSYKMAMSTPYMYKPKQIEFTDGVLIIDGGQT